MTKDTAAKKKAEPLDDSRLQSVRVQWTGRTWSWRVVPRSASAKARHGFSRTMLHALGDAIAAAIRV